LEKRIESRLDALRDVTEPRLLHWDLWDGNVLRKEGRVSGIVDFERAIWGDPLMEFYFGRFHNSKASDKATAFPRRTRPDRQEKALRSLHRSDPVHRMRFFANTRTGSTSGGRGTIRFWDWSASRPI